jgi:hypothetical protein
MGSRKSTGAKEIARVFQKTKKIKTEMSLMSDGSTWERSVTKKSIKSPWVKVSQIGRPNQGYDLRRIFLDIFMRGGWKNDKKKVSPSF